MANTRIVLNSAGVRSLLKSSEMQGVLKDHADAIKNRCGDGYETDLFVGKKRANAMVSATTYQAKADNLRNNTILKAVK